MWSVVFSSALPPSAAPLLLLLALLLMIPPPPRSILFPYTTLFRSRAAAEAARRNQVSDIRLLRYTLHLRSRRNRRRRSEEHTSELQSRGHLVCRLLLEKKT